MSPLTHKEKMNSSPIVLVLSLFALSLGFSTGPGACGGPNGYISLNNTVSIHTIPTINSLFWVLSGVPKNYTLGQKYTIWLNGSAANATIDANGCPMNAIAGYLVVAKDVNGIGQGTWDIDMYTQLVHCATTMQPTYTASLNAYDPTNVKFSFNGGVAVGHTLKFNQNLTPTLYAVNWTAPSAGAGPLTFTGVAIVDPKDSFIFPGVLSAGPPASTTGAVKVPAVAAVAAPVPLNVGQISGIVIGVVLFVLVIALILVPIVFIKTHKNDPVVQRWTQRMTRRDAK